MPLAYGGEHRNFIEPAIAPLGFDWKMGVSILSGIAAKEIIVSTMGVLYQASPESLEESASLAEKLKTQKYKSKIENFWLSKRQQSII